MAAPVNWNKFFNDPKVWELPVDEYQVAINGLVAMDPEVANLSPRERHQFLIKAERDAKASKPKEGSTETLEAVGRNLSAVLSQSPLGDTGRTIGQVLEEGADELAVLRDLLRIGEEIPGISHLATPARTAIDTGVEVARRGPESVISTTADLVRGAGENIAAGMQAAARDPFARAPGILGQQKDIDAAVMAGSEKGTQPIVDAAKGVSELAEQTQALPDTGGVPKFAGEVAAQVPILTALAMSRGAAGAPGTFAVSQALQAGGTGARIEQEPGERGSAAAVATSLPGAGAEAITFMRALRKIPNSGAPGFIKRMVESGGSEAITEGVQQTLERAGVKLLDPEFEVFSDEGREEILKASKQGGTLGLLFGVLGGGNVDTRATVDPKAEIDQTLADPLREQYADRDLQVVKPAELEPISDAVSTAFGKDVVFFEGNAPRVVTTGDKMYVRADQGPMDAIASVIGKNLADSRDTATLTEWLKNDRPELWTETRKELEAGGDQDIDLLEVEDVTDQDVTNRIVERQMGDVLTAIGNRTTVGKIANPGPARRIASRVNKLYSAIAEKGFAPRPQDAQSGGLQAGLTEFEQVPFFARDYQGMQDVSQTALEMGDLLSQSPQTTETQVTTEAAAPGPWTAPEWRKRDALAKAWLDPAQRMRQVQRAMEGQGLTIDEEVDAYQAQLLESGRAGAQMRQLHERQVAPLIKTLREGGISIPQFNEYLYARHAPERNAYLRDQGAGEMGSGMSDHEAQAIINRIENSPEAETYRQAATMTDRINNTKLTELRDSGRITGDDYSRMTSRYQHYAPLKTLDVDGDYEIQDEQRPRAQGVTTAGVAPSAGGATPTNILSSIVGDAQGAIRQAERSKTIKALAGLTERYPNPDLWTVQDGPPMATDPNVFGYMENGQQKNIVISDPDLAEFLRIEEPDTIDRFIEISRVGKGTRFLANLATSWNPGFWFKNLSRDIATGGIQAPTAEMGADIMAGAGPALKGILAAETVGSEGGYASAYRDFEAAGGKMTFMGIKDLTAVGKDLQKEMERGTSHPFTMMGKMMDVTSGALENATRLSAFVEAKKRGKSDAEAAAFARGLTTNFSRKGRRAAQMNSFFMFANASLQGSSRAAEALWRQPYTRKAAAAVMAAGAANYWFNRTLGGEEEERKIPPWEKGQNAILLGLGGEYLKVPLPHEYRLLWSLGRNTARAQMDPGYDPAKAALDFSMAAASELTPTSGLQIGSGASGLWGLIRGGVPTTLLPIVDVAANKKWTTGDPIRQRGYKDLKEHQPWSQSGYRASGAAEWAAEMANELTGGDDYTAGLVDVSPNTLDYFAQQYFGPTKAAEHIWSAAEMVASGDYEDQEILAEAPITRGIFGMTNNIGANQEFKDVSNEMARIKDRVKDPRWSADPKWRTAWLKENAWMLPVMPVIKQANSLIRKTDDYEEKLKIKGGANLSYRLAMTHEEELNKLVLAEMQARSSGAIEDADAMSARINRLIDPNMEKIKPGGGVLQPGWRGDQGGILGSGVVTPSDGGPVPRRTRKGVLSANPHAFKSERRTTPR